MRLKCHFNSQKKHNTQNKKSFFTTHISMDILLQLDQNAMNSVCITLQIINLVFNCKNSSPLKIICLCIHLLCLWLSL
jgi:hypothetical protein